MSSGFYIWSQTAASNGSADSTVNFAEGQAPSSVNDSARALMAGLAKMRDDQAGSLTTGGSSTAYTLTTNSVFDTLAHLSGQTLKVKFNATNGASPTLNVDSLGAKAIHSVQGTAIGTGAILANSIWDVTYDNANSCFVLSGAQQVQTTAIADAAITYAKVQNVGASKLLGNPTGSGAAPSEIGLSGTLFFSGTNVVGGTPRGYIDGLILSKSGASTLGISAGVCRDGTNAFDITLGSAYTKTTSSWAVGSGNGGLDTGAIATGTWYYAYGIYRSDTSVSDVLFTATFGSPTMPANYSYKRYIGAFKTDGSSNIINFIQVGDEFLWDVTVLDRNSTLGGTSAVSQSLTVPSGQKLIAIFNMFANNQQQIVVSSLDQTDAAPSIGSAAPTVNFLADSSAARMAGQYRIRTNTSGQVRLRTLVDIGTVFISTVGWIDQRGKNS